MSRRKTKKQAPTLARDIAIDPGPSTAPCPYEAGTFIPVVVNRRVDLLATERSAGRITQAQFLVGRFCQAIWERGSGARLGSGGWTEGQSRDQTVAHELAVRYAIGDAKKVTAFDADVVLAIGLAGLQVLRRHLADGQTFRDQAGDAAGKRQVADSAKRFRFALVELTDALHTSVGRRPKSDRHQVGVILSKNDRSARLLRRTAA